MKITLKPIKLTFDNQRIKGLNCIWNYSDLYRNNVGDCAKAMPSVLLQISKKLLVKQSKYQIEPTKTGKFTVKLQPYEAYFLEMYIRGISCHMAYGYEKAIADSIADDINQNLTN